MAERQDWQTVQRILDYRMAVKAHAAMRAGRLAESGAQRFYGELLEAQGKTGALDDLLTQLGEEHDADDC